MRTLLSIGILTAAVAAAPNPIAAQEKAPAAGPSLVGGWTRNADLSAGAAVEAEVMAVAASVAAEAWAAAARLR